MAEPWKPPKGGWVKTTFGMGVKVLAIDEPSRTAWVKGDDDWEYPATYHWSQLRPNVPTPEELAALDAAVAEAAEAYWYGVPGLPGLPGSRRTLIIALDAALKARRDARARLAREA